MQVLKISFTISFKSFAVDLNLKNFVISITLSSAMLLLCLILLVFFLFLSGTLNALITSADKATNTLIWHNELDSDTKTLLVLGCILSNVFTDLFKEDMKWPNLQVALPSPPTILIKTSTI